MVDDEDQEDMGWDTPKSDAKSGGDPFNLRPWDQDDKKDEEVFADTKKEPNPNLDSKVAPKT